MPQDFTDRVLFTIGLVLFAFIMIINISLTRIFF